MKIITQTTATAETVPDWPPGAGIARAIHHELPPDGEKKIFVHVTLSDAGVQVRRGSLAAGLPLSEIMRLALAAEPKLSTHAV